MYATWRDEPDNDFPVGHSAILDVGALWDLELVYPDELEPVLMRFIGDLEVALAKHGWVVGLHGRDMSTFLTLTGPRELT